MSLAVAIGVVLEIVVILSVLYLCSRREDCQLPEEPWLGWDGELPDELELDSDPRVGGKWKPGEYPGADVIRRQRPR